MGDENRAVVIVGILFLACLILNILSILDLI